MPTSCSKRELLQKTEQGNLHIEALSDNIFHIVLTRKDEVLPSAAGYEKLEPIEVSVSEADSHNVEAGKRVIIDSGRLRAELSEDSSDISWSIRDGEETESKSLLKSMSLSLTEKQLEEWGVDGDKSQIETIKTVDGERSVVTNMTARKGRMAYQGRISFAFEDDEQIHGLGQGEDGIFNYRGHVQYLYQHNMRIPMPVLMSDRGYCILVDCGCLMTFSDEGGEAYLDLDAVEELNLYFIAGDDLDEIVASLRRITGKASMLPKWAFGYIQSKERYQTQEEILDVAREYRKRGIGLDCVVQDWQYWDDGCWGYKRVDKKRYPDLKSMRDQLHDMHVHSMVSIWPNVGAGNSDHDEMAEKGYLLADNGTVDVFNEDAKKLYWEQASRELFEGFDSWWCDSTEPFTDADWNGVVKRGDRERYDLVGGELVRYLGADRANLYALRQAKGLFENQRAADSSRRMLNLTRSGFAGSQKFGAVLWSGDICATWDTLRKQIVEGLNMSMSGYPYWTLDIGAFFAGHVEAEEGSRDPRAQWFWKGDYPKGVSDLGYRELYVRWYQLGAFLPLFRSHGTDTPREIWQFGAPGEMFYDALAGANAERYRLMPYIYSLAEGVHLQDGMIMRSLLFDFAGDDVARTISDEYMFGHELLICPVTEAYYYEKDSEPITHDKIRRCYLPAGTDWYDFRTGERIAGGQYVDHGAPIDFIPVFARAGAIIPMEHVITYAEEIPGTPLEIHIFPGQDGRFVFYEDAGDGYEYEDGIYNAIEMSWNDSERIFTIGPAEHHFDKSIVGRTLKVVLPAGQSAEFVYDGHRHLVNIC